MTACTERQPAERADGAEGEGQKGMAKEAQAITMSVLEVPGARLYYELHGTGPLLVLVPGAKGEADTYQPLVHQLSSRYRVLTYDRRGFSRSSLHGPQDYERRLDTDTDDLRALIADLSEQPVTVFGNSSGAIVALHLLAGHPDLVTTVVAHEPPTVNLLPDAAAWRDFFDNVYDTYRASGIPAAMQMFATGAFSDADRRAMHRQTMQHTNDQFRQVNTVYWLEHELRQYPRTDVDLAALAAYAGKLVLAAGGESRGQLTYRCTQALAEKLGTGVVELPGGHIGCVTQPAEFATALRDALGRPPAAPVPHITA
jgi:acetyltransferase/esterase